MSRGSVPTESDRYSFKTLEIMDALVDFCSLPIDWDLSWCYSLGLELTLTTLVRSLSFSLSPSSCCWMEETRLTDGMLAVDSLSYFEL